MDPSLSSTSSTSSALTSALDHALSERAKSGVSLFSGTAPLPTYAPDFFSNDYLSLSSFPQIREGLVERFKSSPRLLGSQGSRILSGTTSDHVSLEEHLRDLYNAPAAMIFNSGYIANLSFLGAVPQPGDVFLHDEYIHASCRDGMLMSRARSSMFSFAHNSVSEFEERLLEVLREHPQIAAGKSTLFIVLESIYSMDGDFGPLPEIVRLVEKHVPAEAAHIVVDEAHSVGLIGPQGKGLVAHLGLEQRVHTRIHPLTKAPNMIGAVVLTTPTVCRYIVNYSRPTMFSTSLPHMDLVAIRYCFDVISGSIGDELRGRLNALSQCFLHLAPEYLMDIPSNLLQLYKKHEVGETKDLVAPIFPILTTRPVSLQKYLNSRGYAAQAFCYPVVPRNQARIRVTLHAATTDEDVEVFLSTIRKWALEQMEIDSSAAIKKRKMSVSKL
ncbi:PLP-dependent transferase [Infundibulicybe gibba]|nr:PLP-dependent transferase [Infundibulicybe gibba]